MAGDTAGQGVRVEHCGGFIRARFDAMASPCEILCETRDTDEAYALAQSAAAEVWRIEEKFSRYRHNSLVGRINSAAGKPVELDDEASRLIDFADKLCDMSDGRFDITSGVFRQIWRFDGVSAAPAQEAIDAILERVGWHRVGWQPPTLQVPSGMEIDLGGIGKEYAVDRAAAQLRDATTASCLVNLGGDLAVTRAPAGFDHWRVGIDAALNSPVPGELINVQVGSLATSGDTRRFVVTSEGRVGHILDPSTGKPVPNAPRSVTVAADTCTQAGMLATLAMLQGEGAESFLEAQGVAFWCARDDGVAER